MTMAMDSIFDLPKLSAENDQMNLQETDEK